MTAHTLKVVPPYFDALYDGSKMFEVRRNDRAFQRGDTVLLREFDPTACALSCGGKDDACPGWTHRVVVRDVSFVYSGDPRFGGIEPGFVVLGLTECAASA